MLNEAKMVMDIADGIAIVINSDTGIYYGLNGFGTMILEALASGINPDQVLKRITQLSSAPADCAQKVSAFMDMLIKEGLLIPGPEHQIDVQFDEKVLVAEKFEPTLQSYNDAQEMLLADPIHEVKEAIGWTPEKNSIGYTKEETKEREKKMGK